MTATDNATAAIATLMAGVDFFPFPEVDSLKAINSVFIVLQC